jgi:hypothetical protein
MWSYRLGASDACALSQQDNFFRDIFSFKWWFFCSAFTFLHQSALESPGFISELKISEFQHVAIYLSS